MTAVRIGSAEMPFRGRDPKTRRPVPTDFPVWIAVGDNLVGRRVGTLWRAPSTGRWSFHETGHGVRLADDATPADALARAGYVVAERAA